MGVPVGMKYTSTVEGEVAVSFACKKCGYEGFARVKSKGEGEGTAFAFVGSDGAKERAREEAGSRLRSNAEAIVSMAACPSCSHVDDAAVSRARSDALLKAFGLVLAAMVLGWWLPHRSSEMVWLLPLVAGIVAAVQYNRSSWLWTDVNTRVRFLSGRKKKKKAKPHDADEPEESDEPDESEQTAQRDVDAVTAPYRPSLVWGDALNEATLLWPFHGSLKLGLLRVDDDGAQWLEHADLDGVEVAEAQRRALVNLKSASRGGVHEVEQGVYSAHWDDGLAASRLSVPGLFSKLDVAGKPIAFTASEDTLFIAGSADSAALEKAFALSKADLQRVLADKTSAAGRFTATPWELSDGAWRPWTVPEGHPLEARVAALDAELGAHAWRP